MAFAFALSPLQQQQQQQQTPNPFQQQQQQTPNPFQQQTPNPFQQQTPNPFQQQNNLFLQQQQQQQQQQLQFQLQQQQQQLQQQQQQQQRQTYLFTADKSSASYNTKWADLHPDSQKFLLQIEERILEYRDESQRLDQCSRLYDSSVSNDGFKLDASHIMQELGGISTAMERERVLLQELMTVVKDLMRDTEVAVRSFMMLRPRFLHPNVAPAAAQTSGTTTVHNPSTQPISSSILSVVDFYSGLPRRPSPFLEKTVARFEKYLGECQQWIEELEHLLLSNTEGTSSSSDLSLLNSLPKVMSNVHDFFVHVAAKVESLHQYIESMKIAYLADQRCRGDGNDPFLEADRRETAKREAAARRVHPTVHLPAISQPSTQVAGLFASSALPGASTVSQPSVGTSAASSGSGFSFYSTPSSSAPAASTSLFSTPSASAPASTLFGSSSFQPQHSLFGSASTSPLGSTQTPLFGSSTPFSSTPAIGSSPLFSTPSFASGAATGSGASFGATSKSAKPKSRTPRR